VGDVRIRFDPEADAATIALLDPVPDGAVVESHVCDLDVTGAAVVLDRDESGHLVQIEILGATTLLPSVVLDAADRAG